jgi:hypothetical protein
MAKNPRLKKTLDRLLRFKKACSTIKSGIGEIKQVDLKPHAMPIWLKTAYVGKENQVQTIDELQKCARYPNHGLR